MDIAKGADVNLLVSTSRCLDVILSLIPTNEPGIPKEYVISIVEVGELDGWNGVVIDAYYVSESSFPCVCQPAEAKVSVFSQVSECAQTE